MNRGSITKKKTKSGVRWYVVLDLGRDPETGRRIRKWHGGFATRKEAVAALAHLQGQRSSGTYIQPSSETLASFLLEEWLPAVQPTLRPGTHKSYRDILQHAIRRIGSVRLCDLSPSQLNRLYADLLASGRVDGKGGLAPRTVQYCHTVLHRALRDAVKWGKLARNPAERADPPSVKQQPKMRVWDSSELAAFLVHVEGDRLAAAFRLTAATGMRRGEVLGLRWTDLDLDRRQLYVAQTLVSVGYVPEFSTPKAPRSRRRIDLDGATVHALRAHRATQLQERLAWGEAWTDTGLVFTKEDGTSLHPQSLSPAFERAVKACGLSAIRFHDLRHTHATLLLSANVHPKVVADRLGHASITITLDTYSHVVPSLGREAADLTEALLAGG